MNNNRSTLAVVATLLLVGSVLGPALFMMTGPAAASETVAVDGSTVNATNSSVHPIPLGHEGNFTLVMNHDITVSASGSQFWATNVTPASAEINSSTGTGTAAVNAVDGGVYVNETGGTNSVTVTSLNITVNTSKNPATTGSVVDAINTSEVSDNRTQLVESPDGAEVGEYVVHDGLLRVVNKTVTGEADAYYNETSGKLEVNSTGSATLGYKLTLNQSALDEFNLTADDVVWNATFDMEYTENVTLSEDTNQGPDTIVKVKRITNGTERTFVMDWKQDNNVTQEVWVYFHTSNLAPGETNNSTVVYASEQDMDGWTTSTFETGNYGYKFAAAGAGGEFTETTTFRIGAAILGLLILGGVVVYLSRNKSPTRRNAGRMQNAKAYLPFKSRYMNLAAGVLVIGGLTMLAAPESILGGPFGFWVDILSSAGVPSADFVAPVVIGLTASVGGAIAILYMEE